MINRSIKSLYLLIVILNSLILQAFVLNLLFLFIVLELPLFHKNVIEYNQEINYFHCLYL